MKTLEKRASDYASKVNKQPKRFTSGIATPIKDAFIAGAELERVRIWKKIGSAIIGDSQFKAYVKGTVFETTNKK